MDRDETRELADRVGRRLWRAMLLPYPARHSALLEIRGAFPFADPRPTMAGSALFVQRASVRFPSRRARSAQVYAIGCGLDFPLPRPVLYGNRRAACCVKPSTSTRFNSREDAKSFRAGRARS
jgi:hypothetical protein